MCLAVPAKVESIEQGVASCRVGEGDSFVKASLLLLDEDVELGDYVIVHAGFAIRRLDAEEARDSLELLREMAAMAGLGSSQ